MSLVTSKGFAISLVCTESFLEDLYWTFCDSHGALNLHGDRRRGISSLRSKRTDIFDEWLLVVCTDEGLLFESRWNDLKEKGKLYETKPTYITLVAMSKQPHFPFVSQSRCDSLPTSKPPG